MNSLGQFYTTNYSLILQNLQIPEDISLIIEPFCGQGHLLQHIPMDHQAEIVCYDIDPKTENTIRRDVLLNPPDMTNGWIITNPPFLARNKNSQKEIYDKYDTNDLYKAFLKILIQQDCQGGILILPINFICSVRKSDVGILKDFTNKYCITQLNIFEFQVFDDTTYNVCSFLFSRGKTEMIDGHIYSSKDTFSNLTISLPIGREVYSLSYSRYKVSRLTNDCALNSTNIFLQAYDTHHEHNIHLRIDKTKYIGKSTSRMFATLCIEPYIDENIQDMVVERFNERLKEYRKKYHSLFLTNYRDHNRKRVSFDLVYRIVSNILGEIENQNQ